MKRVIYLVAVALLAVMLLAPTAMAQETAAETTGVGTGQPPGESLVDSGGVSIVLPAAALLLGSGVLAYAVVRRR